MSLIAAVGVPGAPLSDKSTRTRSLPVRFASEAVTRFEVLKAWLAANALPDTNWLALDDDAWGWPTAERDHLVWCRCPIDDVSIQAELVRKVMGVLGRPDQLVSHQPQSTSLELDQNGCKSTPWRPHVSGLALIETRGKENRLAINAVGTHVDFQRMAVGHDTTARWNKRLRDIV